MKSIEPLPEAVRSSLRSGIIVYDLARVVEELVFNSLDAGATKVSVDIGIGTCYVKIVDNGCGVTRDGLALLGQRYATSKFKHPNVLVDACGSFGFHGEALCSISDVSLLEIITKARGKPNGYCKVMKGSKCLHLGINNDRKDVGTTVVARDLFYNQPVRRKHILSSPKKVLHSIKKCVLRIALMHSDICFKVLDVESEDELLCTSPSHSPLFLLKSGFGIDVSSSLHEVNESNSMLKLSGYISGPVVSCCVKALQYIYINSRFICKGPIHKLLNQLAARISFSGPWKDNIVPENRKRTRSQEYPTYILNVSCPRSYYDLSFEPSKTSIEFKDWNTVLDFVEYSVTRHWNQNISCGDSISQVADITEKGDIRRESVNVLAEEYSADYKAVKKRCGRQNYQSSLQPFSPSSSMHNENWDNTWSDSASFQNLYGSTLGHKEHGSLGQFCFESNHLYEVNDKSFVRDRDVLNSGSENCLFIPESNAFSAEDDLLGNTFITMKRSENIVENKEVGTTWNDMPLEAGAETNVGLLDGSISNFSATDGDVIRTLGRNNRWPVPKCCSSRGGLKPNKATLFRENEFDCQIDRLTTRSKELNQDVGVEIRELAHDSLIVEPKNVWWDEVDTVWSSPCLRRCGDLESMSTWCLTEGNLQDDMGAKHHTCGSSGHSCSSKSSSLTADLCFGSGIQDVERFIEDPTHETNSKCDGNSIYHHFTGNTQGKFGFHFDTMKNSSKQDRCLLSCHQKVSAELEGYIGPREDDFEFQGHNLNGIHIPKFTDLFSSATDHLYLDVCNINNSNFDEFSLEQIFSLNNANRSNSRRFQRRTQEEVYSCEKGSQRSRSAPPFYQNKRKFFSLKDFSTMEDGKYKNHSIKIVPTFRGTRKLRHNDLPLNASSQQDSLFDTSADIYATNEIMDIQNSPLAEKVESVEAHQSDFLSKEVEDPAHNRQKWRNSFPQIMAKSEEKSHNLQYQDPILDISSGVLHLAGDSSVTKFTNKKCLENAKVLQQVDKKFIPVVANGTLAIIDQHAADERIRLEELRQKVLSGEMKTITYLEAEQELILPEIGYQLLHNYAEQVQSWGWICNSHVKSSRSFKKNLNLLHSQPALASLVAVPCILGVNLTDMDLLEFLQQLADTDGSSTMPPSVLHVLNSKACRGAIMFGDKLLPSECSLLVEELKRTSLCFQCAHGRPTTVPLVNLKILHVQLAKLGLCSTPADEEWHGLCKQEISLERAMKRLSATRDHR